MSESTDSLSPISPPSDWSLLAKQTFRVAMMLGGAKLIEKGWTEKEVVELGKLIAGLLTFAGPFVWAFIEKKWLRDTPTATQPVVVVPPGSVAAVNPPVNVVKIETPPTPPEQQNPFA